MKCQLPALAFGGQSAFFVDCPNEMGFRLKSLIDKSYDSLVKSSDFLSQSSIVNINGLTIAASSSSPIQFKSDCLDSKIIFIPFSGDGYASADGFKYHYRTGHTATFLTNNQFSGESSFRSMMMLKIDAKKLEITARGILGLSQGDALDLELDKSQVLNLQAGTVSFDGLFRKYAALINQFDGNSAILSNLRLDEGLYGAAAMMLKPALFFDTTLLPDDFKFDKRLLDRTCQYIQANLTHTITLAMLDQVSSMSRRKLHYAFQDRFECAPMQWIRDQRLTLAHSQLMKAEPWQTVISIALASGFTKMSTFAQFYKHRFGELPSATLKKSFLR
jgi:AraC-like DNA-binding protein